jgi:predicted phage-related endonuclease
MTRSHSDRRTFIGGSDARIIMGDDESALLRLWREKRGEAEPEDCPAMTSTPAHLFRASTSLRQPHAHTTAVLRYEHDTSPF